MKKLSVLAPVLLMAVLIVACDSKTGTPPGNTTIQTPTDTSTPEESPPEKTPTLTPGDEGNRQHLGIDNIAEMNQPLTISAANRFGENQHTATISVEKVYRGEEARLYIEAKMEEANMVLRAVLDDDNEEEDYLLVQFSFTLDSVEVGETARSLLMVAYSETLEPYPNLIVAGVYNNKTLPQLNMIDVSVGQTVSGYWLYIIDKTDLNPVVAYANRLLDNSDGAWFRLT